MFSFKLVACTMFGDIKGVVWVEETIWSLGERARLEIRWLSDLETVHTDLSDMGHFLKQVHQSGIQICFNTWAESLQKAEG